jgi:5-methylcytosine-specific restriction endonuclease McrA
MKAVDGLKRCSKCGETKAVSEFHKETAKADGRKAFCKCCCKEKDHVRYMAVRQQSIAAATLWYQAHMGQKKETDRTLYLENAEGKKADARLWYATNWERGRKQRNQYAKAHPEMDRCHTENRRALKIASGGTITAEEWQELVGAFGRKCLCCGATDKKLTMDHVIPLARGGVHSIANVQPLCLSCNSRKNVREVDYRCP